MSIEEEKPEEKKSNSAIPEGEKLHNISDKDLNIVLEKHKEWLRNNKQGKGRALLVNLNLEGRNLSGAFLQEAIIKNTNLKSASLMDTLLEKAEIVNTDFSKAVLISANFSNAHIEGSDFFGVIANYANFGNSKIEKVSFQEASLSYSLFRDVSWVAVNAADVNLYNGDFENSELWGVDFRGANLEKAKIVSAQISAVSNLNTTNLRDCDFRGTVGLKATDFAGADITGAKLPENIRDFKVLENIEDTAKNARKIFLTMLLGCAYSCLTILSTTDGDLLINTVSSPLPIIGTAVPMALFYIIAPILLTCFYLYLHVYLQKLWTGLAGLPAIFEDGKPLFERAYPWPLISLVRRHLTKLRYIYKPIIRENESNVIWFFKKNIKQLMYLINGTWPLSYLIEEYISIFLAWFSVPLTLLYYWWRYISRQDWLGIYIHIVSILLVLIIALHFYREHKETLIRKKSHPFKIRNLFRDSRSIRLLLILLIFPILMFVVSVRFYLPLNLSNADISIKPDYYWQLSEEQKLESVIGAQLSGKTLYGLNASNSFLVKANLSQTWLEQANLSNADLKWANLENATLIFTNLREANLKGARLGGAIMNNTDLRGADLREVVGLTQKQLDLACGDGLTKLPPGLTIKSCPE